MENIKLKSSDKGIMLISGSIRGAIAFGLAISISGIEPAHKEVIVSSTLMLVLITCLLFGAVLPFFVKLFRSFDGEDSQALRDTHEEEMHDILLLNLEHPNSIPQGDFSKTKNKSVLMDRWSYKIRKAFIEFEELYIKPLVIANYPACEKEHEIYLLELKKLFSKKIDQ